MTHANLAPEIHTEPSLDTHEFGPDMRIYRLTKFGRQIMEAWDDARISCLEERIGRYPVELATLFKSKYRKDDTVVTTPGDMAETYGPFTDPDFPRCIIEEVKQHEPLVLGSFGHDTIPAHDHAHPQTS
jgi:hypothetical protein